MYKHVYITIANKLPEPLLTSLVNVCCNLNLILSGISDNLACIPSLTIESKLRPKSSLFHILLGSKS